MNATRPLPVLVAASVLLAGCATHSSSQEEVAGDESPFALPPPEEPRIVGDLEPADDEPSPDPAAERFVIADLTLTADRSLGERRPYEDNSLTVRVTVENAGDATGRGHLKVRVNDRVYASGTLELAPGESKTVFVTNVRLNAVGDVVARATVGDAEAADAITLAPRPRPGDTFDADAYSIRLDDVTASADGNLTVSATVHPDGDELPDGSEVRVRASASCSGTVDGPDSPETVKRVRVDVDAAAVDFMFPACDGDGYYAITFTVTIVHDDVERSLLPIPRYLLHEPRAMGDG